MTLLSTLITIFLLLLVAIVVFSLVLGIYLIVTLLLPTTSTYYEPHYEPALHWRVQPIGDLHQQIQQQQENSSDAGIPPQSPLQEYVRISPPNTHVSLTLIPASDNVIIEGSLSAPVWCSGMYCHQRNGTFSFPSEETIHDGNMLVFRYDDVLSVKQCEDGVELILCVRSRSDSASLWRDTELFFKNQISGQERNASTKRHLLPRDGLIQMVVKREFPERDELEPFRSTVWNHFRRKCVVEEAHLQTTRIPLNPRCYQVVLCGQEASRVWETELQAAFEWHDTCICKVESMEELSKWAETLDQNSKTKGVQKDIDGIICIGDFAQCENALVSGLKQNQHFDSAASIPPLAFIPTVEKTVQFSYTSTKSTPQSRIHQAISIVKENKFSSKNLLRVTSNGINSVRTTYTSESIYYGLLPELYRRRSSYRILSDIINWKNGILYALMGADSSKLQSRELSLVFEHQVKEKESAQKKIKGNPFHLCISAHGTTDATQTPAATEDASEKKPATTQSRTFLSFLMLTWTAPIVSRLRSLPLLLTSPTNDASPDTDSTRKLSALPEMKSWRLSHESVTIESVRSSSNKIGEDAASFTMDFLIGGEYVSKVQQLNASIEKESIRYFDE